MKEINIADYGKRHGFLRTFKAGQGRTNNLHIPNKPTMKHAFIKMLFLISLNPFHTRKEILNCYRNSPLIQKIFEYGNSFNPSVDHYWSDLHRKGYIRQLRDKKDIIYDLTPKGVTALLSIPYSENRIFGITDLISANHRH